LCPECFDNTRIRNNQPIARHEIRVLLSLMPGIKADFGGGGLGKCESKLDELAELLGASKAGSITVIDIVRMYTGSERS
jgi:hypothetical protein